ncbi:MAG: Xaa-Pro aminopeptidase [Pseudomonadota bacterium]
MNPATPTEHKKRRDRLMGMMSPGSIAIIPGAVEQRRNRDIQYLFRQDSDFFYLTGFCEPQALLVLIPGRDQGQEILFCAERDPRKELYDGERLGPERASQVLQVDDAFPISDMGDILPGLLEGRERIYMTLGEYPERDRDVLGWVAGIRQREAGGAKPPGEFVDLKHHLHELRLVKSKKEIALIRRAVDITVAGHLRAMHACREGLTEGQLEAELTYEFMRRGARTPAYPSIVGAGDNACVLHYVENREALFDGELVLIDAGCEYQHYAGDVTRTFPVSGQFSEAQREIYEIVLAANEAAIAVCHPGTPFNQVHETALKVMVEGLLRLGLLSGDVKQVVATGGYKHLVPHNTSHWLGIDVHDVGDYQLDDEWRELSPGMVLTVEPGIYFPRHLEQQGIPNRYLGIGVRIEDDVLITASGCEVLSSAAPKGLADVEAVIGTAA